MCVKHYTKEHLKQSYADAYKGLQRVQNEDAQWEYRRIMARIELIAYKNGYDDAFVEDMRSVIKGGMIND